MQNTMTLSRNSRFALELSAALTAAVIIPQVIHLLGVSGSVFLPIYTAVMLAGLFVHPLAAVLTAAVTPLINHLVSGMPVSAPLPVMQILTAELLVLALVLTASRKFRPTVRLVLSLVAARLAGLLIIPFHDRVTMNWWLTVLETGLPGMLIQFAIGYMMLIRFGKER